MLLAEESVVERLLRDLLGGGGLRSGEPEPVVEVGLDGWHLDERGHPWVAPASVVRPGLAEQWRQWSAEPDGADQGWAAPGVPRPGEAGTPSATADPGQAARGLVSAVDAVAAEVPSELPPVVALARARVLLREAERLRALAVQALADVDTRALHTVDDAPSTTAWVRALAVPGVDAAELTLSRRLARVPQVAARVRAGRLSLRTAGLLAAAVARARPFLDRPDGRIDGLDGEPVLEGVLVDGIGTLVAEQIGGAGDAAGRLAALRAELTALNDPGRSQLARWEAGLLAFAEHGDPALLRSGIALLTDALLPAEHDRRAAATRDERGLDLVRDRTGSGWHLKGRLDDETGELLATALAAAAVTDPAGPADTSRHASGRAAIGDDTLPMADWPAEQPAPRSRRRQRHDALARALRALLDAGALGMRGKTAPHLAVTVELDFAEGLPGSLPARTDHGGRLSRTQLRRLACTSLFTRLVLDARRRVVSVSHTQRTSTALERLILKTQSGPVCAGRGCARGPATGHRLVPHHASLFSRTGTTELADTVLLCELEHDHHLHDQGRTLRLKDGRVLGPDGWVRR